MNAQLDAIAAAVANGASASEMLELEVPDSYRGLVVRDSDAERRRGAAPHPPMDQELDAVLSAYGAKRLIIAHTPSLNGIAITSNGRLARIDTGISRYYGGPLSWLEIIGDQMIPHVVGRPAS